VTLDPRNPASDAISDQHAKPGTSFETQMDRRLRSTITRKEPASVSALGHADQQSEPGTKVGQMEEVGNKTGINFPSKPQRSSKNQRSSNL